MAQTKNVEPTFAIPSAMKLILDRLDGLIGRTVVPVPMSHWSIDFLREEREAKHANRTIRKAIRDERRVQERAGFVADVASAAEDEEHLEEGDEELRGDKTDDDDEDEKDDLAVALDAEPARGAAATRASTDEEILWRMDYRLEKRDRDLVACLAGETQDYKLAQEFWKLVPSEKATLSACVAFVCAVAEAVRKPNHEKSEALELLTVNMEKALRFAECGFARSYAVKLADVLEDTPTLRVHRNSMMLRSVDSVPIHELLAGMLKWLESLYTPVLPGKYANQDLKRLIFDLWIALREFEVPPTPKNVIALVRFVDPDKIDDAIRLAEARHSDRKRSADGKRKPLRRDATNEQLLQQRIERWVNDLPGYEARRPETRKQRNQRRIHLTRK